VAEQAHAAECGLVYGPAASEGHSSVDAMEADDVPWGDAESCSVAEK